ncbi:hypothetical protein O9G_000961 [Rozella allomycis CSF55]|uniref:Uncharacterized protein n=1 Tax=Rozella allomycis (strain CSF55) TaxID=988480 RepID=A0A075ARG1_ROZAC|nr:hypothetical protein O9G_000961 [Rozella allomycis CSF55]|eukprot:EPZ31316.1 hypothetical protein O9G_000961 [Rozella allomycis CSF55]
MKFLVQTAILCFSLTPILCADQVNLENYKLVEDFETPYEKFIEIVKNDGSFEVHDFSSIIKYEDENFSDIFLEVIRENNLRAFEFILKKGYEWVFSQGPNSAIYSIEMCILDRFDMFKVYVKTLKKEDRWLLFAKDSSRKEITDYLLQFKRYHFLDFIVQNNLSTYSKITQRGAVLHSLKDSEPLMDWYNHIKNKKTNIRKKFKKVKLFEDLDYTDKKLYEQAVVLISASKYPGSEHFLIKAALKTIFAEREYLKFVIDYNGKNMFLHALLNGSENMFKYLIDVTEADKIKDASICLISEAFYYKKLDIIDMLLETGVYTLQDRVQSEYNVAQLLLLAGNAKSLMKYKESDVKKALAMKSPFLHSPLMLLYGGDINPSIDTIDYIIKLVPQSLISLNVFGEDIFSFLERNKIPQPEHLKLKLRELKLKRIIKRDAIFPKKTRNALSEPTPNDVMVKAYLKEEFSFERNVGVFDNYLSLVQTDSYNELRKSFLHEISVSTLELVETSRNFLEVISFSDSIFQIYKIVDAFVETISKFHQDCNVRELIHKTLIDIVGKCLENNDPFHFKLGINLIKSLTRFMKHNVIDDRFVQEFIHLASLSWKKDSKKFFILEYLLEIYRCHRENNLIYDQLKAILESVNLL